MKKEKLNSSIVLTVGDHEEEIPAEIGEKILDLLKASRNNKENLVIRRNDEECYISYELIEDLMGFVGFIFQKTYSYIKVKFLGKHKGRLIFEHEMSPLKRSKC